MLFLPERAPFDLYTRDAEHGVQLYVNRVFIMDDCDAQMPGYGFAECGFAGHPEEDR